MKRSMMRFRSKLRLLAGVSSLLMAQAAQAQAPATATVFHEQLAREVGVWDAEVLVWTAPDADPVKSKAVETVRMLGDLWLIGSFEGALAGQKFSGLSQLGYDPTKKKYVGTWIDSMTPSVSVMEGDYDVPSHTLTMMASMTDAASGEQITTKNVTKYLDSDAKTFEAYMPLPGADGEDAWVKVMEIRYQRRKP